MGDSSIFDIVNLKILCNDILYTAQFFDIQSFNIDKEFIELRTVQMIDYPTGLYFRSLSDSNELNDQRNTLWVLRLVLLLHTEVSSDKRTLRKMSQPWFCSKE